MSTRVESLERLFRAADNAGNSNGYLDMDEFQNLANAISAQRLSAPSLRILMGKVDTDADGRISMDEFLKFGNKALDNLNDEVFKKKVDAFQRKLLMKRLELYPAFNLEATVEARKNNLGKWTTVLVTALNDDGSVNVEVMDGPDKNETWLNIQPQHTRPLLETGKIIEGRDVHGNWWPVKVINRNDDSSYIVDLRGEYWGYRWNAAVPEALRDPAALKVGYQAGITFADNDVILGMDPDARWRTVQIKRRNADGTYNVKAGMAVWKSVPPFRLARALPPGAKVDVRVNASSSWENGEIIKFQPKKEDGRYTVQVEGKKNPYKSVKPSDLREREEDAAVNCPEWFGSPSTLSKVKVKALTELFMSAESASDNDDLLDLKNFQSLAYQVTGMVLSIESLETQLSLIDEDSDGKISLVEWLNFSKKFFAELSDEALLLKLKLHKEQLDSRLLFESPPARVGAMLEAKGGDGMWWPVEVVAINPDGTYQARVHDGFGTIWKRVKRQFTQQRLQIGAQVQSKDRYGKWWPITIDKLNDDGTYAGAVQDGSNTRWKKIHRCNIRDPSVMDVGLFANMLRLNSPFEYKDKKTWKLVVVQAVNTDGTHSCRFPTEAGRQLDNVAPKDFRDVLGKGAIVLMQNRKGTLMPCMVQGIDISKGSYLTSQVGHSKIAKPGVDTVLCGRIRRLPSRAVVESFLRMSTKKFKYKLKSNGNSDFSVQLWKKGEETKITGDFSVEDSVPRFVFHGDPTVRSSVDGWQDGWLDHIIVIQRRQKALEFFNKCGTKWKRVVLDADSLDTFIVELEDDNCPTKIHLSLKFSKGLAFNFWVEDQKENMYSDDPKKWNEANMGLWVRRKQLRLIREYVGDNKTSKYHASINPILDEDHRYSVIFSQPTKLRPVPAVVVNTLFTVHRGFLQFEIEEDTHRRRSDVNPFCESWIDLFLLKKQTLTKAFDMSDAFTKSRTKLAQWEDFADDDDEPAVD